MNNPRRKKISKLIEQLDALKSELEEILSEEQESFDNIPEAFEGTDPYAAAEEALDYLDTAFGGLEEVIDSLNEATN